MINKKEIQIKIPVDSKREVEISGIQFNNDYVHLDWHINSPIVQKKRQLQEVKPSWESGKYLIPINQKVQVNSSKTISFYDLELSNTDDGVYISLGVSIDMKDKFTGGPPLRTYGIDEKLSDGTRLLVTKDELDPTTEEGVLTQIHKIIKLKV